VICESIQTLASNELSVLSANSVTALHAEANGDVWIGTPTGTVARLRNGLLTDTIESLPRDQNRPTIDGLWIDRAGTLWAREGDDVHHFVRGSSSAPLPYPGLSSFGQDRHGAVFYVGEQGLARVDVDGTSRVVARPATPPFRGTPGLLVDGNDSGFRQRFALQAQNREAALLGSLAQAGVDCLELHTDEALDQALLRFAQLRKRASQLSSGGPTAPLGSPWPVQHGSLHA
jgi:hypothetical protein